MSMTEGYPWTVSSLLQLVDRTHIIIYSIFMNELCKQLGYFYFISAYHGTTKMALEYGGYDHYWFYNQSGV